MLSISSISKTYPNGVRALDDVTIEIPVGMFGLLGPNGAGKSTLIAQIAGALRPDRGQVWLNGQDVTALDTPARARRGLGRTFQISSLAMDYTVLQSAMIGALGRRGDVMRFLRPVMRDTALREAADTALDQVGLSEFRALRTADLSHGQRRQLELAVALTLNPRAFVMDEPMAGLGAEGSKRLITFLSDLRARTPILLVEHDMDAVFALADRISVLVGGRIIATGPVSEIRANPEVRRAYLGQEDVQP